MSRKPFNALKKFMLFVRGDIVPIGIVVFEHGRNFRQTKPEKIRQIYIPSTMSASDAPLQLTLFPTTEIGPCPRSQTAPTPSITAKIARATGAKGIGVRYDDKPVNSSEKN
jgi:hypothetical protein